jgi:hypothetical protein
MVVPVGFDCWPIQLCILEVLGRGVRELPMMESRVVDRLGVAEGVSRPGSEKIWKKHAQKYALDDILPFRAQYYHAKFYAGRAV